MGIKGTAMCEKQNNGIVNNQMQKNLPVKNMALANQVVYHVNAAIVV